MNIQSRTHLTLSVLLLSLLSVVGTSGCSKGTKKAEAPVAGVDGGAGDGVAGDAIPDGAQTFPAGSADSISFQNIQDALNVRVIYFDYDSSRIHPDQVKVVKAHGQFLSQNPDARVTLEGHADERGSREYNLALGERRAIAVKRQLVLLGTSEQQILVKSYGEERPAALGNNEISWRQNRRVEILY